MSVDAGYALAIPFTKMTVKDPDTGWDVELQLYKHPSGGLFAIDASFLTNGGDFELLDPKDPDSEPVLLDMFATARDHEMPKVILSQAPAYPSYDEGAACAHPNVDRSLADPRCLDCMRFFPEGDGIIHDAPHRGKFDAPDFGVETIIVHEKTRMQLRCESAEENPNGITYLRVCDPHGDEIMYWSSDEWREEPQWCMNAIIGALSVREIATVDRYAVE